MREKRWIEPAEIAGDVERNLAAFTPIERQLLAQRGVTSAEQAENYLARGYKGRTDPFLLKDMDRAVDRLLSARQQGERVVVYGDYDADGVTATALLVEALSIAGLTVEWYVPNRFSEGYGLNEAAILRLREAGASLLVSVDCGIRAVEIVRDAELDIIITDHHLPGDDLPPAVAIINPNRSDDAYPYKSLAGVGIAFKLAQGLMQKLNLADEARLLDLVAVGTVADMAPLGGENRSLVWRGLERLNSATRPGLSALAEFAGHRVSSLDARALGFGIGPRLNAAGRLEDGGEAVRLLLATTGPEAWQGAKGLDELNRRRRQLTSDAFELARQISDRDRTSEFHVFAVSADFHEGVVGLVASRLVDEFYRPVFVARDEHGLIKGSARSISEFHVTEALDQCQDLLSKYGGHRQAAGFSLERGNLAEFQSRLHDIAEAQLADLDLVPKLPIDATLGFDELGEDLMEFIGLLEPSGQGNPYPVFASRGVVILSKRAVGAQKKHLKLSLRDSQRVFDAIAFNMGDTLEMLPRVVDVAYRLERNEFRGVVSLQLNVQDLRPPRLERPVKARGGNAV